MTSQDSPSTPTKIASWRGKKHRFKSQESYERSVRNLKARKKGEYLPLPHNRSKTEITSYRQNLADRIRAIGEETIETLDPNTGEPIAVKKIDVAIRQLYLDAMKGKTAAIELIFDRGWGKVPTPVQMDLKGEILNVIQNSGITIEEALADPVLGMIAQSAGVVEGKLIDEGPIIGALPSGDKK